MQHKELKITDADLQNYKMFKTVIQSANYDLKGDAVKMAGLLFNWFDGLEEKLEYAKKEMNKKFEKNGIKKIGE